MPPAPLVTIVLPTHNRPDVLKLAIESVLGQTVQDLQLLVIGDGCTDDTAAVVAAFADPRIRWFDLPKAPHYGYANINVALPEARGEFIAYMAHDDLWLPDHLELLLKHFADPGVEIAYSRPLWVSPSGDLSPLSFNLHDPTVLEEFVSMQRNSVSAACFVFRRSCIDKYGGWDEQIADRGDWDVWARIIRIGGRRNFAYLPQPTCLHFQAIWKTEANPGPAELFTWRDRFAKGLVEPIYRVTVEGYPTEQAAFAERLQADPAGFAREIRRECQRALDRMSAAAELEIAPLVNELREQATEIQLLGSRLGVFEYRQEAPDCAFIYGPGCFADEGGSRWLWREARLFVLSARQPVEVELILRAGERDHYEHFPLRVEASINGSLAAALEFKSSGKKQSVRLSLNRFASEVKLHSSAAFSPARCGISQDHRELSVQLIKVKVKHPRRTAADAINELDIDPQE